MTVSCLPSNKKNIDIQVHYLFYCKELVKLTTCGATVKHHILYHFHLLVTHLLAEALRCLAALCQKAGSMNQCFQA